jgi:pimeloyl-ACP methyl ester carboxylesterase
MGKILKVLFVGIIIVLLIACSKNSEPPLDSKTTKSNLSFGVQKANSKPVHSKAGNEHLYIVHKNGQTFLVWSEKQDSSGEWYGIYRHSEPITKENLDEAQFLYRVHEGSAYFFANRYKKVHSNQWEYRYLEKMSSGEEIPLKSPETGFFVWTIDSQDLDGKANGQFYYAVTIILQGEEEGLESGYTAGPVLEGVYDPLPVEIPIDVGDGGHLFVQYMDLKIWNPTFHAPNQYNQYYGLNEHDPIVQNSIQYAYDYVVYEPNCDTPVDKASITVILHALDNGNYPPKNTNDFNSYCTYEIYPIDWPETWYFGFARNFDYRKDELPILDDYIVNYTEQRILKMIFDLARNPIGPEVDTNRIYVYGHSMGGSGALAFSLRYPNVFAAAYASEPMTNYLEAGEAHGTDWRPRLSVLWGTPEENLPVQLNSFVVWAKHLQKFNGMGVWDWQNHRINLYNFQGAEIVPIGIAHGLEDVVIEWKTQGKPVYRAFEDTRRAWGGMVTNDSHTWLNFQGTPPGITGNDQEHPFSNFNVVKNEVIPGFSNASNNSDIPPKSPSQYNQTLSWSSSWNTWDKPPIDTPDRLEISICSISSNPSENLCDTGTTQTVDITPRRIQNFVVESGKEYIWENRTINNNLMYLGRVTADHYGLITVRNFVVFPEGNRLVLKPASKYLQIISLLHNEN